MASYTDHISDLLQDNGLVGSDVKDRLVAIEAGMKRMEELLGKLIDVS